MHLYALDSTGEAIFSRHAEKKSDYFCIECGSVVRLREGIVRRPHFYHLNQTSTCRQNGKSLAHLEVQLYIQTLLPYGEAALEYRFTSINRIADVAWKNERLVFEVQCSPLPRIEMEQRVADYRAVGYQVVWILHDQRYNRWRLTALEQGLKNIPHYYTDILPEKAGKIYDQWQWIEKGLRKSTLAPLPVDLSAPYRLPEKHPAHWPVGFQGDLGSLDQSHPYWIKIQSKEKQFQTDPKPRRSWLALIKNAFDAILRYLLKKYCQD